MNIRKQLKNNLTMKKIIFRNLTNVKFQQLKNAISKDKLRPQLMGVFLDVKNEIIVDKNTIIDSDVLDEIINVQAKSIFIHKY